MKAVGRFAVLGLLSASAALAGELDLAKVEVVRPRKATPSQQTAADELVKHLKLVCDSTEAAGGFRFVFARPDGEPAAGDFTAHAKRDGNTVWFWGDDRERSKNKCPGSAFAVYRFLESALGVRWVKPGDDGIVWTEGAKANLPDGWRWDWTFPCETTLFRGTDREWGRRLRYFHRSSFPYRHSFTKWQEKYLKDHPEYFGQNPYGTRGLPAKHARSVKLCLSNPAVIDQILADWQAAGTNRFLNVCPNDGTLGYCYCKNCRALDADAPGENFFVNKTDRYVNFWNRLVAKAREVRPDVQVVTYIYSYYRHPPRREKRFDYPDNMIFGYVPTQKDDIPAELKAWREIGMRKFFLRPNFMCYRFGLPRSLERFLYDTHRFCLEQGGCGYDYDGHYEPILGLEYYVIVRLAAFPEMSFEAICDEYYSQFGALAPVAKEYYERVRVRCDKGRAEEEADRAARKAGSVIVLDDSLLKCFALRYHTEQDLKDDVAALKAADASKLTAPERQRWDVFVAEVEGFVERYRSLKENLSKPVEMNAKGWRSSFDVPSMDGWTRRKNFDEITSETASFDRFSVRCKTTEKSDIGIWRTKVPVTPGSTYSLTFDVKMDEGVGSCGMRVVAKRDGTAKTLARFKAERADENWKSAGGTFKVPEGVEAVSIYFQTGIGGAGKSVWVDNIEFTRQD